MLRKFCSHTFYRRSMYSGTRHAIDPTTKTRYPVRVGAIEALNTAWKYEFTVKNRKKINIKNPSIANRLFLFLLFSFDAVCHHEPFGWQFLFPLLSVWVMCLWTPVICVSGDTLPVYLFFSLNNISNSTRQVALRSLARGCCCCCCCCCCCYDGCVPPPSLPVRTTRTGETDFYNAEASAGQPYLQAGAVEQAQRTHRRRHRQGREIDTHHRTITTVNTWYSHFKVIISGLLCDCIHTCINR